MSAFGPVDKQRQTLAEVWNETSLRAPRWVIRRSLLTGCIALAGFAVNPGQWTYSMLYLIVGCFGARALLTGQRGRGVRRMRFLLDVAATAATVILVLQILEFLLGGTVGLIRA